MDRFRKFVNLIVFGPGGRTAIRPRVVSWPRLADLPLDTRRFRSSLTLLLKAADLLLNASKSHSSCGLSWSPFTSCRSSHTSISSSLKVNWYTVCVDRLFLSASPTSTSSVSLPWYPALLSLDCRIYGQMPSFPERSWSVNFTCSSASQSCDGRISNQIQLCCWLCFPISLDLLVLNGPRLSLPQAIQPPLVALCIYSTSPCHFSLFSCSTRISHLTVRFSRVGLLLKFVYPTLNHFPVIANLYLRVYLFFHSFHLLFYAAARLTSQPHTPAM